MVYLELLLLHFKYLLIYFFVNIILILFNLFYLLKQRNKYMHTYISIFEESCKGNYKLLISESNTLENIFWIISSNIVFQYFYTQNNNKNIDIYIYKYKITKHIHLHIFICLLYLQNKIHRKINLISFIFPFLHFFHIQHNDIYHLSLIYNAFIST